MGYLSGKEDSAGNRINTNVLALRRNVTLQEIWNGTKGPPEVTLEKW